MKTTLKSRLRSIIILGFIVVASLFISMWQLFGLHGISAGAAYTQAKGIATAMNEAASDWKTKTDIEVGDETNQNGSVVTINTTTVSSIVVPTGAQVTIDSVEPSVKHELENDATYSQLIFDVPVTVSAESVLTINTDVVFRGGVEVYGTLIIGGMAFNQSSMLIANKANSYAEIDSQGVIVKGSLNNDAAREGSIINNDAASNGSININAGATLTIAESTKMSYTDAEGDNPLNHDGGALFLKAGADGTSLGLTVDGNIVNGGSIIYESGATWSGTNVIGDGAIVSAAFVSELSEISGTVVLYPDIASGTYAAGTSFTLGNSSNRNWSNVTLLSFGRTILKNGANDVSYNLTNVNLGGGTSGEKTFTQGANELIFDGGAQWTNGNASGYSLSFISGEDASAHTAYRNDGVYSSSALINVSDTLNTYSGVKITRHETRAGESKGGGVNISNWATLTMYGGEVSYNAVTRCSNNGAGGGIFASPNSKINIYNGLVTRNALANYQDNVATYSADGAGIAINGNETEDSSVLTIFGGEISYNCGAQGSTGDTNAAADGGGVIGRVGATVRLYGGAISNNWTGGFGGAVLLWSNSKLEMTGGEISGNYAAFGGGINMTTNSTVDVSGGQISGNTAFYNNNSGRGGYGGGICVGAKGYETSCSATISGNSIISENSAVYGGGLAVYTRAYKGILNSSDHNILTMTGGTITNNSVHNANSDNMGSNGNGVYVAATGSKGFLGSSWEGPILYLSGNATIDSSNNVSFYIEDVNNAGAPISVSGELTGSGLAALVYLDNPGSWTDKNIVSYASGVTADRNKFLLDDTTYTFYEVTSNVDYLRIQNVENNQDYVASISGKGNYSSLEDAVAVAADGDTITVLRSATISQSMQVSGKNITIVPASGEDITLGVASDFTVTGTGATDVKSLFIVSGGGSLTIGNNAENTKIAFDGNKSSGKDMSMVYVAGGSFTLGENATLRNNNSTGNAGALYLGQGTSATIKGTIADTSGTYGAIYINAGGSIILDGATFSGNCSDSNGNNYAVYAVGNESTVKLDGDVTFGGNAVYTENKINLGDSFRNGGATIGATIGVTFPAARTAGTTIVEIPQTFVDGWQNAPGEDYESAAQYVSAQFNVVNMDSDYMLILSTQSTTTANALVVSKSVVFVFDFTYSNGFNEGSTQIGISGITFKGIHEVLSPTVAEQFAGRIHTRGNLVVLELQSGSNFPLDEFLGYASRSGHSLISWQVNGTSTKYNYNGNLAYLDSEDEVSVRSVWVENTYNIAFNNNSATFGQGVTFGGKMDNQEITSNTQDKITLNAYTLVGYAFKEWNTQSDGEGTKYAIDAVANFSQLTADAPVYEYDSSGIITKAVYNITLYAQWECIFSGGEGTAANPFIINSVKDLYILEATVNGTEYGTDNAYAVPNNYFNTNTNDDEGNAIYLPESYEGYYFKLSDSFDNSSTEFRGVIGRISSRGDGSKAHENQEANITAAVYGENATIGGTGAAAGNPFMGYFDGNSDNGKTIALNINKQKVDGYGAGVQVPANDSLGTESYINGDETLVGVGLFGYADHATIRNVNLSGSVHGYAHVGGLVGYAFGGNISNIYTSADVTSGGHDVGGVIGTFYEVAKNYAASSVTDAVNIGSVSYAPRERDNLAEELDIEDNWNELGVMDDAQGVRFGGIVGAGVTLRLTGGYNLGNITARYGIGGVVGTLRSLDNSATNYSLISQSFNTGEITATAGLYASSTSPNNYVQDFVTAYTGGITGRLVGRSSVNTSFNAGKVTSTYVAKVSDTDSQLEYVGMNGFLGIAADDSATYIGARGVGGIVGFTSYDPSATSQSGRMSISNVYNTGDVYSFAGVGGIAGYLAFGNISEAFNGGNITAYGTHYDAASQSRVNGGYMLSTGGGGETIYVAYLGAIVGRGINASLTATVSFNMNSTYSGYTDPTVQAVGDSGYNAQFGFGANSSSAKALASSQMRVVTQGTAPSGFDPTFDGGAWSFKLHNDTYSYYPQLSVFADSSESINVAAESGEGFKSKNISTISQESAKIKYRTTDEEQGEVDKPVIDNKKFKLIFNLGGGSFNFSSTSTDNNGIYSIFTGKHKHYYASDSGSDYYYLFTFPTDKTDYGTGTEAGGTDELEMPDDPVRTGYTFAGWYIDAGCTQEFNFEAIPGQDTTIYAKWEAVIYTITYENVVGVGGTWSGEYNKTFSILTVDEVRLPTSTNLSRRGYEFVGWKYSGVNDYITSYLVSYGEGKPSVQLKNSSGSIVAIVAFEDLTAGTLVLTAEWDAEDYTIEYRLDAEDGFVSDGLSATLSGETKSYTVASGDIALPEPVRTGYDFTGWKLVSIDGSTEITDEINRTYYTIGGAIGHIRGNTVGDFVLQAVWQINTIRLELDARGGTIADFESYDLTYDPATGLYYKNVNYYTLLGDVLVKEENWVSTSGLVGNEFNGWYVSSTASGNPVDETTPVSAGSGRYTLYAGYKTAEYTITVQFGTAGTTPVTVNDGNKKYLEDLGFVFSEDDTWATLKVTHGYDATEKLSPLSKALVIAQSYYFSSWEVNYGSGSIYNVTGDLTITAEYVQNRVTVNFVGFNGELCGSVSVPVGGSIAGDGTATEAYETLLAEINATTVPGYTFKGKWTYSGNTFDENTVVTSSMVVYAVYEAWDVTVNFYLVDGVEVSESFTFEGYAYEFGSPFGAFPSMAEIINKNSAYTGYRIDGVYLESDLTNDVNVNTVIAASMFGEGTTADSCNLNLYIKVSKENYSIIFNANGGAFGSATTVSGTYQYGGAVSYGQTSGFPVPTRTGYKFVSWYISGTYGAFNVTIQAYEDYTGEEKYPSAEAYYTQKLMEALKAEGYTGTLNAIANWTEEVYDVWFYAGADDAYFVIPQSPVDGVTFYNEPNGEAVTSGRAKYCVVKTKYDNMPSVNASVTVERKGYTFSGWLTYSNSVVTAVHDDSTYTSSTPIKANWTVGRYSIVFITNGGSPVADKNNIAYGENLASVLADVRPTRTGYKLVGWYTDSNLSDSCPDTMPDSTLVLYAKWTEVTNTLTLTITLPAGVTSADSAVKDAVDTALGLKSSVSAAGNVYTVTISGVKYGTSLAGLNSLNIQVEETSYSVVGMWQSGGMGVVLGTMPETAYSASATFEVKAAATGENTVTFYRNDGTEDVFYTLTQSGDYIDKSFEGILTPTREGYTFIGWFTDKSGGSQFVFGENGTSISADLNLYAHWQKNTHTVTYKYNDGATADKTKEIEFDKPLNTEATEDDPSRDGYIFKGWYIDSACTVKATTMPDSDITLYAKWEAVGYKLIFVYYANEADNANGADDGAKSEWTAEIGTAIPYPDADIKPYYELEGWYIQGSDELFGYANMPNLATLGGETDEDNYVTLTIYAKYSAIEYTVDYIGDDGSILSDKLTVSADTEATKYALKTLENKTGYEFVGWNVVYQNVHRTDLVYTGYRVDSGGIYLIANEGTGEVESVLIGFEYLADIDLIAVYEPEEYTVTFNANYGTEKSTTQSFTYGQSVTLNGNTFSRTGYTFLGWATSTNGEVVYSDKAVISNLQSTGLTLYAKWRPNTYSVLFDANGGTGTDIIEVTYDEIYKLPESEPERTGYKFVGWFTAKDGTGTPVTWDTPFNTAGNVTLYAKWTANSYTVTFNANAGDATGSMDDQTFTYGTSQALTANEFSRTGYTFLGWATSQGSDKVVYVDEAIVLNLTAIDDATVTLYAVWEPKTYTVTFNSNGGSTVAAVEVNYGEKVTAPAAPTRDGYKFVGWYVGETEFKFEETNITDNITITAKWVIKTYTVSFNSNGGSAVEAVKVNHGEKVTAPKAPTKDGYLFAGWYLGETAYDFNGVVTADVELTAEWTPIEYTISYVLNGGTNADDAVTTFTVESEEITLLAPTREGYSFDGWYNAEIGGDKVTVIEAGSKGNITLYARWTITRYSVTLNGENVSGSGDEKVDHGAAYTYILRVVNGYSLPETVTIKVGGVSIEDGYTYNKASGVITINAGKITGDVEIIAEGVIKTYTVTFNSNGGSTVQSQTVDYNGKATRPVNDPTKDGYEFVGWYVGETEFKFEETNITDNITITAKWVINTYTVSFNSDGGSTVDNITVNHGEKVTAPKAPTNDGYAFAGWYVGDTAYDFNTAVTADVELTAKWNAIEYTISYVLNGGTNAGDAITTFTVESGEITLLAPTREGYSFDGWYNAETGGDKVTVIEAGSIGNITLYARWTTESHTVSFNSDGGSTVDNITVNHGEKVTAPEAPTKYGYAFAGWYVGDIAYDFNKAVTADVELTAKWNAIEYTISYVLNGGTNAGDAITTFTVESGEITLLAPTREGYSFDGWYNAETGGDKVTVIEAGSIGNITLYARWTTESHTVSFNSDGGSTVDNITVNHGEKVTAPKAPTKDGYAFAGWYVGDIAYDFNTAVTADVALTAKWDAIEYTISYVLNGGTNDGEVITEYTIESDTIVHPVPVRDGYTFLGWFDAEVGGNKSETIESGSTGHVTLYAVWRIDSVEVSFEANGGSLDDGAEVQKVDYGNTVAFVEPVRENYLFLGWYTDEALTQSYDFNSAVTQSFTLYAKWRLQQVVGQAPDGTTITVSSDSGFDDGTMLRFTELSDESSISQASGSLTENMTLKRLYDIELVRADGSVVPIEHMLSVGISAEGLGDANGKFVIVYVPDDGGEAQQLATHIGSDGKLYFFIEHFSFYAIVDMTDIVPQAGFAWWWILVAIGGCALIAIIALIIARNNRRYELNYVNGGIPSVKLRESKLIDLPIPERESEVFEGWYYDEDFRDRAFLTSMPKQNLILYAKWRTMTQDERIARDKARAEAAATKKSDDV